MLEDRGALNPPPPPSPPSSSPFLATPTRDPQQQRKEHQEVGAEEEKGDLGLSAGVGAAGGVTADDGGGSGSGADAAAVAVAAGGESGLEDADEKAGPRRWISEVSLVCRRSRRSIGGSPR